MNSTQPKSSHRALIALVLVLCAMLAGTLYWSHGQIAKLQSAQDDLQKKLDAAAKLARVNAADAAGWHDQMNNALTATSNLQKAGQAATPSKRNFTKDELATLSKNPALQSIIASQQSAVIDMTYGALLDHLKLSPDERDYLEKLLIQKQMVQVTNGMQMMDPTLSADQRTALGQAIGQGMADADAKIRAFLNDDADYGYYQTYSQQEPERLEVGMFEKSLGDSGLDPNTADQLATMLNDARNSYPFTVNFYDHRNFGNPAVLSSASFNQFLDEQTQFQAAAADKAAALLTPAQLDAFKQNQAAVRQMTKMQLNSIMQLAGKSQ